MKKIYLDNNATTCVDEKVLEAMLPFLKENYANPSSMYEPARISAHAIEKARLQVADFLGVQDSKQILFTSCGTESANTAIKGVVAQFGNLETKNHIITTRVEHPCVLSVYENLEKKGYKISYIGVDENGDLDIESLLSKVTEKTILASVMHANNETGAIYPAEKIASEIKKINKNTKIFTDGVQAAGKIPIKLENTNIDFYSISGHKFHAPKGIGALYVKKGNLFEPFMLGGHQENSLRAGTYNTPYIVALGEAAKLASDALPYELSEVKRLRDKLENGILSQLGNAKLNSKAKNRVPNTTNIGFEYIEGELILLYLNELGIYASSGSACTSGSLDPSHVLRAQKVPFTSLHGSIRFSLSRFTTEDDIDYTIEKVPEVIKRLAKISPFQKELNELGL
ncbi:MAG: aminotransferase class V-fold PLP-dependent enzyme [Candidatus Gastranaerophilales bacterium]|nr:aminotransferase class V-fold PLP-dependent enzyme [Candidatus Gastranaerophilales bacterium]